jgi:uncharacterized membrane protein YbhN (UPF0104 family)
LVLARIPARDLWTSLASARVEWLMAALSSTFAMLAVRSLKWHGLLRTAGASTSRQDSAKSLLAGFALAMATPGRMGEFGRWLFVPESRRGPILLLNILDRMFDSWALATAAVASLAVLRFRPYGIFAIGVWTATLPLVLGSPALVALIAEWPRARKLFPSPKSAAATVASIRTPKYLALGCVTTALDALTMFCLLRALQPASPKVAFLAFPWIVLAGSLPVTVSGLGLREGAALWVLGHMAVPGAVAVNVALLLSACSNLLPATIGGVWLLVDRSRKSRQPGATDSPQAIDVTHLEENLPEKGNWLPAQRTEEGSGAREFTL